MVLRIIIGWSMNASHSRCYDLLIHTQYSPCWMWTQALSWGKELSYFLTIEVNELEMQNCQPDILKVSHI